MNSRAKPMRGRTAPGPILRRSFAIPRALVDRALALSPSGRRRNPNAVVVSALERFVAEREREMFDREMAEMAKDPAVARASRDINRDFRHTLGDGLPDA